MALAQRSTRKALGRQNGWKANELGRGVGSLLEGFPAIERNFSPDGWPGQPVIIGFKMLETLLTQSGILFAKVYDVER